VETALASVSTHLAIAKDDEGDFYIPNTVNSMGNMAAGEGYKLYLNSSATLVYPSGSSLAKATPSVPYRRVARSEHFKFNTRTGDNYAVIIESLNSADHGLKVGDEIGIFTGMGLCVGGGLWNGGDLMALTAWADDIQTDMVDGFRPGDEIGLRCWNAGQQTERSVEVTFTKGGGKFGEGAYCAVRLSNSNPVRSFSLEQNYPNPFNPRTTIEYSVPHECFATVEIFNVAGQRIRLLSSKFQDSGIHQVIWDGRDDSGTTVGSGIYLYMITASTHTDSNDPTEILFQQSRKMLFVK
jgi:hypothetical protein